MVSTRFELAVCFLLIVALKQTTSRSAGTHGFPIEIHFDFHFNGGGDYDHNIDNGARETTTEATRPSVIEIVKKSNVTYAEDVNFGGIVRTVYLSQSICYNYPNDMKNGITAINPHGSCIKVFMKPECTGDTMNIVHSCDDLRVSANGCGFNDEIKSFTLC